MAFFKGYKYIDKTIALQAQKICQINQGLPKIDGNTLQAVYLQFAALNTPNFWYIVFCDESKVLGEPTTFEVTQPDLHFT